MASQAEVPPASGAPTAVAPAPKRRWFLKLVFLFVLGGGVFIYFLPALASRVLSQPEAMDTLSQQLPATVRVGEAHLAWNEPVRVNDVKVTTSKGKPVAQIDKVASGRSLLEMLTRPDKTLELDFVGLRYSVTVSAPDETGRGKSFDEMVRSIQASKMSRPSRPMRVKLKNSGIDFRDEDGEILGTLEGIDAVYEYTLTPIPTQTVTVTIPRPENGELTMLTLSGKWDMTELDVETVDLKIGTNGLLLKAYDEWFMHYLGSPAEPVNGALTLHMEREPEEGFKLKGEAALVPERSQAPAGTLKVRLDTQFDRLRDQLFVPELHVSTAIASLNVQGEVKQLGGAQLADLKGSLSSPGLSLIDLLPPEIRQEVQVDSLAFSDLAARGALRQRGFAEVPPLELSGTMRWKTLHAYGLHSQDAELKFALNNSRLTTNSLRVPINGGSLRQLPAIDFSTQPPTVLFESGVMLENVQLTEEVCRGWMRYVSPALANATSTVGTFSLGMHQGQAQLQNLKTADLSGAVLIHSAQVKPGPVAGEMLQSVGRLQGLLQRGGQDITDRTLVHIDRSEVNFRLVEGRVYHDRFGFNIGKVPVATTGSVGLDHSIDMVMTISMPEQWRTNAGPILQALQGEQVQVAIGGTLNQPQIDATTLADFGKNAGLKAGAGLLEKILEKRANRRR
ncbi:hypothetical protein [Planctomicrobium sp. SH664]|uniref:hypothetical protein n=1 Tax=Planctomicrobium sp. SH664 TaxID=3448125 RepID=UPI003F5B7E35